VIINNGAKDLELSNVNHTLSQFRTTNQQVHWVVQVIPYVSKGRSHGDCRLEASYGYLVNLSQDIRNYQDWLWKVKEHELSTCFAVIENRLRFWRCSIFWISAFLLSSSSSTQGSFHGKLYARVSPLSVATSHPLSGNVQRTLSRHGYPSVGSQSGWNRIQWFFCVCH